MEQTLADDTIVAVSTAAGVGGVAVIRVSGSQAVEIVGKCWRGRNINEFVSHTAHLGRIVSESGETIDEVVLTLFRGPNSFTGEDTVEMTCHGSLWIQREIVSLMIRCGARPAEPGEFTRRAFLNGRIDLAQAEGVADLIASSSRAAHRMALQQTSGAFSRKLGELRDRLVEFASLLELELDFSEEEVEFADRTGLKRLAEEILHVLERLADSYYSGRVLKDGIPVVIAGAPNAGKSTLLNALLEDDRAIVSDIPGTTRDIIEDTREIEGVLFRFVDTAGLRDTDDTVEMIGISRAEERLAKASIILWLVDMTADIEAQMLDIRERMNNLPNAEHIILQNKIDITRRKENINISNSKEKIGTVDGKEKNGTVDGKEKIGTVDGKEKIGTVDRKENISCEDIPHCAFSPHCAISKEIAVEEEELIDLSLRSDLVNVDFGKIRTIEISASEGIGLDKLRIIMHEAAIRSYDPEADLIVTNSRHYAALLRGAESLRRALEGLSSGLSADFVAQDVRETLHHLSLLTGSITTPDLLSSIFSRFCIGK